MPSSGPSARLPGCVGGLRLRHRVGGDDLVGVEAELSLVVDLDPVEIRARDFLRRRHAGFHVGAQLADRLLDHVVLALVRAWLRRRRGWLGDYIGRLAGRRALLRGSEVRDRANLARRQVAKLRRSGQRCCRRFDRGALARRRGGVDALTEHDEVKERAALARRQRNRVHVGLEVPVVAGVGQRRVERVVEPVAGEVEHVPVTVICGPPTIASALLVSSGVATSTHASPGATFASPLEVLTMVLALPPVAPSPD